ncbi:hypothetical protein AGMMS50293_18270 [Spirochaetia bacterium]|nr:hypothetical protein AGMMS50293_18270 [Spirochaetia bacterium]
MNKSFLPAPAVLAVVIFGFVFFWAPLLYAQDLGIDSGDLRIEQRVDGGFHLYIRKKPGIGSVLLTESTRDPSLRTENYAYRTAERNAVNGDEIRILDGVPIPRESRVYSLVDSTPETHGELGSAFHIYIPYILYYGYEGGRHGEVYITDGTYLNVRAFALPYADYRGAFKDNPFILRVKPQEPQPGPPEGNYMKDAVEAFTEISRGGLIYSTGADDLIERIRDVLVAEAGKNVDIVICLDTTGSMRDDIDPVRRKLIPMLQETVAELESFRIGMMLYKDYNEEYLTKAVPFTSDFSLFQRNLNAIRVGGGGDIPEAVHEALYDGAIKFPWESESKIMILIGDAPPHPRPRGKITKEIIDKEVEERGLKVQAILLPQ